MEKRVRLTSRSRIANDPQDMQGLRQDCGKKTRYNKYDNFDVEKNDVGGLGNKDTDGSKLYEQDQKLRDEMNVTKLRQAKLWERSKLATKLAVYCLGEKAPQAMIKAQAADFLSLGNDKLAKAVSRYAKTAYLYADEQEQIEEVKEEVEEAKEEVKEEVEEVKEEVAEACEEEVTEAVQEEVAEACEEEVTEAVQEEVAEACEEEVTEAEQEEEFVTGSEEEAEEDKDEAISDEVLASLFAGKGNAIVAKKSEAKSTGKVGVQKFNQPQRTASSKISLDNLWAGAPDLSDIF